jgi:Questin oxidase-like
LTNLDEALERFHLADLEYGGGLANHGPMGAEALESLGHQALIPAFVDLYVPRLPPAETGDVMSESEADSALGRIERRSDWVASFEVRLAAGDWRVVLSEVLPDLLPGLFAAAGHGFLRTVHAVRMLEREDSPLRRRELARGLAYWCARYQRLPGLPGSLADRDADSNADPDFRQSLDDFFEGLPCVDEAQVRVGFFFESVRRLDSVAAFSRAIEAMSPPRDAGADAFLAALCRKSAALYCAHPEARIAYVHAVTLPAAMRDLLDYLEPAGGHRGLAALYALQSVAALHAIHGDREKSVPLETAFDDEVRETAENWDEIRYRAACSIQEHAIKMTEACMRSDRMDPDPIFRLAAAEAALRLEATRTTVGC